MMGTWLRETCREEKAADQTPLIDTVIFPDDEQMVA
jgi:hypothetical protein